MDNGAYEIIVKGLVQGVGFRPFVYRIACYHNIKGTVENRNDGVKIIARGNRTDIDHFVISLEEKKPVASTIKLISVKKISSKDYKKFTIVTSKSDSDEITDVSPDIAVCPACLEDMKKQPHRIDYPFINCTNCGPRFSIIKDLPYDRDKTTMNVFQMCDVCAGEYSDVMDRRFHAQPVACLNCGPRYELISKDGKTDSFEEVLNKTSMGINNGGVVTVKGIGGYFMACNALNEKAVNQLRQSKLREGKPFAVMFNGIEALREYAMVNAEEQELLQLWRRPIVLLKSRKELAFSVSMGFNTVGAMLPYMPFHYLLFSKLNTPVIVLTSGNILDEPIIISDREALKKLLPVSDALVTYNREIFNRVDDSVQLVVNNIPRAIRRSRGYVPEPVDLTLNVNGIMACGAELVNTFCLGKGNQAILSQYIGDLKNWETYEFYCESIENQKKLFRVDPDLIVCDLHPEYLSTKYALDSGLPVVKVQHHHAHIAACMAEHNLDEKVIGVGFDGIGLGDDNNIWGGEFFICDLADYERVAHFSYIPMPGGDKATLEPWRMGVAYLYRIYGSDLFKLNIPFVRNLVQRNAEDIIRMIDKNINSPLTSSSGRLFDTVAAILDVCTYSGFHAEAPMRLESLIDNNCTDYYSFEMGKTIEVDVMIKEIVNDIINGTHEGVISAKFHNTVISIIFAAVNKVRQRTGISKVVLSGGTFQNRYLLQNTENKLIKENYQVFTPVAIPANDGGIALGQLVIASKRRELKCV
ncbi:Carbamoyltransferase HypF [subsurface metagenome]